MHPLETEAQVCDEVAAELEATEKEAAIPEQPAPLLRAQAAVMREEADFLLRHGALPEGERVAALRSAARALNEAAARQEARGLWRPIPVCKHCRHPQDHHHGYNHDFEAETI